MGHVTRIGHILNQKSPPQKVAYAIRDISENNSSDLAAISRTSRLLCGHMSKMVKNQEVKFGVLNENC